jgi:hypothetical protein
MMNNKNSGVCPQETASLDLAAAVEQFVAQGGIIKIVSGDEQETLTLNPCIAKSNDPPLRTDSTEKLELLKALVAKGAGINALQYSLRMNKKEIKQLAIEHGIKIMFSRPLDEGTSRHRHDTSDVDDVVAGHAMHYSSLGYTALEIAKILDLNVRQVWNIGKAYRFEFKTDENEPSP